MSKYLNEFFGFQNSTGIYNKLWFLARRQRTPPVVDSGEIGMLRVRDMKNFAMLGGRETLYFDTLRFGMRNSSRKTPALLVRKVNFSASIIMPNRATRHVT